MVTEDSTYFVTNTNTGIVFPFKFHKRGLYLCDLKKAIAPPALQNPLQTLSSQDGEPIGVISMSGGRAVVRIDKKQTDFSQWLNDHADEVFKTLYANWTTDQADNT